MHRSRFRRDPRGDQRRGAGLRGGHPRDRYKDPYMPAEELTHEVEHGVRFWGLEQDGRLLGVMGLQDVEDVTLIRHAYVRTTQRRRGIGGRLLQDLRAKATRPPSRRHMGGRSLGDRVLPPARVRASPAGPGAAPAAPLLVGARAPDRDVRGAGGARLARSGGLAFRCTRMKPHPEMQATSPRLLQCAGALTRVVSGMNDDSGDVRSVTTGSRSASRGAGAWACRPRQIRRRRRCCGCRRGARPR